MLLLLGGFSLNARFAFSASEFNHQEHQAHQEKHDLPILLVTLVSLVVPLQRVHAFSASTVVNHQAHQAHQESMNLSITLGDLCVLGGSSLVHTRSNNKKGAATAAPFGMPDRV